MTTEISPGAASLLLAAGDLNVPTLRSILKSQTPNVQDPTTLRTPLHTVIAALESLDLSNGHTNGESTSSEQPGGRVDELSLPPLQKAQKCLELLLQNGAIWNSLDTNNETPACIAYRLGLTPLYEVMVDAGVRAELLFGRLGGYMALDDEDDEEDEEDEEMEEGAEIIDISSKPEDDKTALDKAGEEAIPVTSDTYLSSNLEIDDDKILDEDKNGVMMSWETHIMSLTTTHLLPQSSKSSGPRVLNIGYGMGIVDSFFQSSSPPPSEHHIVEAHPQILQKLESAPISSKPGVKIHAGRWQDVLPGLVEEGVTFDAIYFDTFAEDYSQLKLFFTEYVIALLDPEGRFSFFNGLGADRQIAYDVYKKVVDIDLLEAGLETEWVEVPVDSKKMEGEGEWKGVRRKYWDLEKYWLPVCHFIG